MINYHVGDLFDELKNIHDKTIIIPHICNDVGKWGAGFVVPLGKYFPESKSGYFDLLDEYVQDNRLGKTREVYPDNHDCDNRIIVCNMIAQHGIISKSNPRPIKYHALSQCLLVVRRACSYHNHAGEDVEIHTCAFGSGLAGGNWTFISALINEIIPKDIPIHIYSLREKDKDMLVLQDETSVQ